MTPAPSPAPRAARSRALVRGLWIAAAVVVAIVWIGAGAFYISGTSPVCSICHEMRPEVATWRVSAHARVGCPACHQAPLPVTRTPEMLGTRAALMQRDLKAHLAGDSSAMPSASSIATSSVSDATCMRCHDMSRAITPHSGLLIDHTKHAERNKSCVSCHLWTAHPVPDAERAMLFMERCFTCHGHESTAKAPGTCITCHAKDFNGRPASHTSGDWRTRHGKAALTNQQPCMMCHEKAFCRNCHGLDMPHPVDWVLGKPGHSTIGAKNREVCAKCHTQKPDLCSMCHHQGFQASKGTWVAQHPEMVAKRGAAFCFGCHNPVFCPVCHQRVVRRVSRP